MRKRKVAKRNATGKKVSKKRKRRIQALILLFDFDGTLVDQNKPKAYEKLVKHLKLEPGLAKKFSQADKELCEKGVYDRGFVFGRYPNSLNLDIEMLCQRFWMEVRSTQRKKPDCIKTLARLKAQGHTLVCVTDNDGPESNKLERIKATKLSKYFGNKIFIGKENVPFRKGTREYIMWVLNKLKVNRRQCVMIGDKVDVDLVPARAVGMSSILVKNPEYKGKWPLKVKNLFELEEKIKGLAWGVFISYSHHDKVFVKKLELHLKKFGVKTWRDDRYLHPGKTIQTTITDAIKSLPIFLIVISRNSMKSQWVREELRQALSKRAKERKIILPVVAEDVPISPPEFYVLHDIKYADFRSDFGKGIANLRKALGMLQDGSFK